MVTQSPVVSLLDVATSTPPGESFVTQGKSLYHDLILSSTPHFHPNKESGSPFAWKPRWHSKAARMILISSYNLLFPLSHSSGVFVSWQNSRYLAT